MAAWWLIPAAVSTASLAGQAFMKPPEETVTQRIPDWAKMAGAGAAPFYSDILHGIMTLAEKYGVQALSDAMARKRNEEYIDALIKARANPSAALAAIKSSGPSQPSDLVDAFLKVRGSNMPNALKLLSTARALENRGGSVTQRGPNPVFESISDVSKSFLGAYQQEQSRLRQEQQLASALVELTGKK